jgi:hypothetical protein
MVPTALGQDVTPTALDQEAVPMTQGRKSFLALERLEQPFAHQIVDLLAAADESVLRSAVAPVPWCKGYLRPKVVAGPESLEWRGSQCLDLVWG